MTKKDFDKNRRDRFNWSDDLPIIEYEDDGTAMAKLPKKRGNMTPSKMISGMRGVYLVAAELSRLGFIVSPTSRGAFGADLLVTDQLCRNAFSVQVKTNQRVFGFWLLNQKAKEIISTNHIYVLVNIRKDEIDYYVVPSKMVSKYMCTETSKTGNKSTFHSISLSDMQKYKDKWDLFGKSSEDDT